MSSGERVNIKYPKELKRRLRAVAARHSLGSADDVALEFVRRGLSLHKELDASAPIHLQLEQATRQLGYSSTDEMIEHLIERALLAYEDAPDDPEALKQRLRGLGYLD